MFVPQSLFLVFSTTPVRDPSILYNTIQYEFYYQLPMGAFQRQILIVQVLKK